MLHFSSVLFALSLPDNGFCTCTFILAKKSKTDERLHFYICKKTYFDKKIDGCTSDLELLHFHLVPGFRPKSAKRGGEMVDLCRLFSLISQIPSQVYIGLHVDFCRPNRKNLENTSKVYISLL